MCVCVGCVCVCVWGGGGVGGRLIDRDQSWTTLFVVHVVPADQIKHATK